MNCSYVDVKKDRYGANSYDNGNEETQENIWQGNVSELDKSPSLTKNPNRTWLRSVGKFSI
jgi:hypothetical protein